MAKLVDAHDSGSCAGFTAWRFKSSPRHIFGLLLIIYCLGREQVL